MYRILIRLLFLCLVILLASDSNAQTPNSLYVSFEIKVPAISDGLGPNLKTIEQEIGQSLATSLGAGIKLWTFQVRQDDKYPWIRIYVEEVESELVLYVKLIPSREQSEDLLLKETWMKSEDLEAAGYPVPDAGRVRKFFEDKVLSPNKNMLEEKLKLLFPIGSRVEFLNPPPPATKEEARGILPLDWNKYCWLSMSYFRIEARTGNRFVSIECKGDGVDHAYSNSGFNGLVVQYTKYEGDEIETHLQDLRDVDLVRFFLLRTVSTGFGDCNEEAVQPTLAAEGALP